MINSTEKLRLALVLPPFVFSGFRDTGMKQSLPFLGVAYLAANVDMKRVDVRIYDCAALGMRLKRLLSEFARFQPHVVGLSAPTFKIIDAHETARAVKKMLPGVVAIAGGDHATAVPVETLERFPMFDFVVYGEGEKTLNELIKRFLEDGAGADFAGVQGICYRENGVIREMPPMPYIEDIDSLAFPAFHLMPVHKYNGVFTFMMLKRRTLTLSTGRGCIYNCVFCNKTIGGKYRYRSTASVIEEAQRDIRDFLTQEFYITDESFLSNREHAWGFCEEYMRKGLHRRAKWVCFSRVDETDPDMLKLMKRAGCRLISYGIESGNEEVLEIIKKEISLEQAINTVRWTKEAGIIASTNFIIGLPGDTCETIRDTINFAFKADAQMASFQIMVPFPGTEAMSMARKSEGGLRLLTEDYTKYCKQVGGAHELETVSRSELERLQRNAWVRFYLRPSKFYYLLMYVDMKMLVLFGWHTVITKLKNLIRKDNANNKPA